jgi:amino-acid N-acetyltransferase
LRALYLLTETAAEFWPRFGFVRIARDAAPPGVRDSAEWSGGCPASAVAMRLDLAGGEPAS